MNNILLLSGGLDSVTLLHELVPKGDLKCLFVDYGQRHKNMEFDCALKHSQAKGVEIAYVRIPDLGGPSPMTSWVVPNRNMVLLSLAASSVVPSGTVYIACNKDDAGDFPDCEEKFICAVNAALMMADSGTTVEAPYLHLTKADILRKAKTFGIGLDSIYTCYRGKEKPCGQCPACAKLEKAIELCGQ